MIQNLPLYIPIIFILTTGVTLALFSKVLLNSTAVTGKGQRNRIFTILLGWMAMQTLFSFQGIYHKFPLAIPPFIFLFGVLPTILVIAYLFVSKRGRAFIDHLPLKQLTYLHLVRIPVEIVLWWLFLQGKIPELMTFEGRNFDILAGISAPFIAYFGFTKGILNRKICLFWNVVSLGLLLNIVVNAFLSAPSPLQKFAFDQPNIAILYFPFSWLATVIVPLVLFAHLAAIRQLIHDQKKS